MRTTIAIICLAALSAAIGLQACPWGSETTGTVRHDTAGADDTGAGLPFTEVASGEGDPGDASDTGVDSGASIIECFRDLRMGMASTSAELASLAAEIGTDPPDVDLAGKVAIGSYMYLCPATGYTLTVDHVTATGSALVVHEVLEVPAVGGGVGTRPWNFIIVDDAGYTSVTGDLTVVMDTGGW